MKDPGKTGVDPKISIRILHRCVFRCPACSTFSGPDLRGLMSPEDFRRVIDFLAVEGFQDQLNISGGEPTLHLSLEEMLTYAAQHLARARIAVFTNGYWVGAPGWRKRLRGLLAGPNLLVRFSLDRQHAEGAVLAKSPTPDEQLVRTMELERLDQARLFLEACRELGAVPGVNFDFAFKGSLQEGRRYTTDLGEVPLYLIRFRPNPSARPKQYGFLAIDVDEHNRVSVYPTLGHIPTGEPLGGPETLPEALAMNRNHAEETLNHS